MSAAEWILARLADIEAIANLALARASGGSDSAAYDTVQQDGMDAPKRRKLNFSASVFSTPSKVVASQVEVDDDADDANTWATLLAPFGVENAHGGNVTVGGQVSFRAQTNVSGVTTRTMPSTDDCWDGMRVTYTDVGGQASVNNVVWKPNTGQHLQDPGDLTSFVTTSVTLDTDNQSVTWEFSTTDFRGPTWHIVSVVG